MQVEAENQIQDLLEILKKRKWQIALPAAFVISLGVAFAVIVPKKYVVRTQVELRDTPLLLRLRNEDVPTHKREVASAQQQIKAMSRIKGVIEKLEWPDYLALNERDQYELRRKVQKNVNVQVNRPSGEGSAFVTITYLDPDADRAEKFLEALRDSWIGNVVERDRKALFTKLAKDREDRERSRKLFDEENDKLTKLRQEYGISPTQSLNPNQVRNEDPVIARIQRTEDDLEHVRRDLKVKRKERDLRQEQMDNEPDNVPVTREEEAEDYSDQIARLDDDIEELEAEREDLRREHSRFRRVQELIDDLMDERAELQRKQNDAKVVETVYVPNEKKAEIRDHIAELNIEISTLETKEEDLEDQLTSDKAEARERQVAWSEVRKLDALVTSYQNVADEANQRFYATRNEYDAISGPEGNPFEITEDVVPPRKPESPNPYLIVAFAILAGLGLGVGSAVFAEFSKNCFRSVNDVSRVMVVPVLGTINMIRTPYERRVRRTRRAIVAASSFIVIGAVVFVTWAWAFAPDMLTPEVREAIEELRDQLR